MPSRGKRRSRSSSEPKYTSANSPKTPDEVAWDHNIDRKKLFGMNKGNAPQYSALTNVRGGEITRCRVGKEEQYWTGEQTCERGRKGGINKGNVGKYGMQHSIMIFNM
eukprot:627764_1